MTLGAGKLKQEVSSWLGISVHPHRFAAQEYRFGKAEVGRVHLWGDVDIPFPRPVHDFLLALNLAEPTPLGSQLRLDNLPDPLRHGHRTRHLADAIVVSALCV
jgi:hypothetical protein